jgi:hypothetical protein
VGSDLEVLGGGLDVVASTVVFEAVVVVDLKTELVFVDLFTTGVET